MGVDWEVHMDDVHSLYIEGGATAEETVNFLNTKYGTNFTLRQFKSRFGGMKKIQKAEWQAIAQRIAALEAEGKLWNVYLHGQLVPKPRVKRSIKRYSANGRTTAGGATAYSLGTNSCIEIRSYERVEESSGNSLMAASTMQTEHASENQPADNISIPNLPLSDPEAIEEMEGFSIIQANCSSPLMVFANESPIADETHGGLNNDIHAPLVNEGFFDYVSEIWQSISFSPSQALYQSPRSSTSVDHWKLDEVAYLDNISLPISPIPQLTPSLSAMRSHAIDFVPFWQSKAACRVFPQLQVTSTIFSSSVAHLESQSTLYSGILSILVSIDPGLTILKAPAHTLDLLTTLNTDRQQNELPVSLQGAHMKEHMKQVCFIMAYLIINRLVDDEKVRTFINVLLSRVHQVDIYAFWATSSGIFHTQTLICRVLESYCGLGWSRSLVARYNEQFLITHPEEHFKLLTAADERSLSGPLGQAVLRQAIKANHIHALEFLLKQGVETSRIDDNNFSGDEASRPTPLEFAIAHSSEEVIRILIKRDTSIAEGRVAEERLKTAFDTAVEESNLPACKALLEAGVKMADDSSFLNIAREEYPELYQMMRESADTKARAICNIIEAAEGGLENLSKFLLIRGELRKDEMLEEALCVSIDGWNETAVRILLRRGVDANANKYLQQADGDGRSPLMRAIRTGMNYFVYLLVQAGALLDESEINTCIRTMKESSRLKYKVEAGIFMIIHREGYNVAPHCANLLSKVKNKTSLLHLEFFLGAGMPVDACADSGWSILQIVARANDLCLVQYLLDRGAKVNQPAAECGGRTALQAAAENGNEAMVNLLLDMGADITAPPAREKGLTVLEAVASSSSCEEQLFNKLLNRGAPVNSPNGSKLLHILIGNQREELLAVALRAGARTEDHIGPDELPISVRIHTDERPRGRSTPLQYAAFLHKQNAIQLLIQHGADINAAPFGDQGASALQAAILSEYRKSKTSSIVDLLLARGADVNAPPSRDFGRTAIQAAASLNPPNLPLVQRFIEVGAQVNAKPAAKGGITAIQAASIAGQIQVVLLLLEHGADVNADAAPEEGRTAIEGAAEHGRLEIVRLLLSRANFPVPNGFIRAIELAKENRNWDIVDLLQHAQNCFNPLTLSYDENIRI